MYIPISRAQGKYLYLVARCIGAARIVEFGTSFGVSTVYAAAAARDNGGRVIGSELEPGFPSLTAALGADYRRCVSGII